MKKIAFLFLSIFATLSLSAQVTTSSISGQVTDANGTPIIGATIIATHTPSGTTYATASTRDGRYNINGMRVGGPYSIEFSFIGYNTAKIEEAYLTVGEEAVFNQKLDEESQAIGEVVVMGQANPVFNSNRTGAQEVVTREMMDKLPTTSRSLSDFTKLTPMSSGNNFAGTSYRYNNITVDGASFNNSFGLASSLGGQTGVEPIALESIDQIQVMIAPFDVRNGGFTGGGINSVTKAGTNDWEASAYFYKKSPSMQGYRQGDEIITPSEFKNNQWGVSLAGPIIKNKLFFFINGEIERQEEPIYYTTANSRVSADDLNDLSNFLQTELGYNPGKFDLTSTPVKATRLTARLDWNMTKRSTLSVKYYFLNSSSMSNPSTSGAPKNGRGPNEYAIPFSSAFYRQYNNFNIVMADLNTNFNEHISNTLTVGFSGLRDYRETDGGFFPQVDILCNDASESYTVFGTEANSYNNRLNSNIFQIQDNLTMSYGKHQITVGTQSDYRSFKNGFAQNYPGAWVFNSIDDFKFNVLASKDYMAAHNGSMDGFDITAYDPTDYGFASTVTGITNSASTGYKYYSQKYSMSDEFPYARLNVLQLGFYAQDKWRVSNNFTLTYGLRFDIPIFMTDLQENPAVAAETYRDGIKVDVSKYPKTRVLVSPRIGFNWKPLENGSLQIRGGSGLFAGTPPYVWLSNQAGNNGMLFGDLNISGDDLKHLGFTGNINQYKPAQGTATTSDIAATDRNFKYPMIWKNNIAIDYKWRGWILTGEVLYSKDINAIYHDNIGMYTLGKTVNDGSAEQKRTAYEGTYYSSVEGNRNAAYNVVLLRNTNKGYSIYTTFQLQKQFTQGPLKGFGFNASYSFGTARAVSDGTSSVATSAWKYTQKVAVNSQELGYTAGAFDGRLLVSATYTANWGRNAATHFGLVYQRFRPFRYSYCYNGDANGDNQSSNDLIYIPATKAEAEGHLVADGFNSFDEAWAALDSFIEKDDYLKKHRGEYAVRNGATVPFANQLDVHIAHDIRIFCKKGQKVNTISFSFDISNFLNLLNKNWGVRQTNYTANSNQVQFLTVTQKPTAANNYTLQYRMDTKAIEPYKDYVSSSSRWAMMFGIKYKFN